MPRSKQFYVYFFLILLLIIIHVVTNYFWISSDLSIPKHDENQYFLKSLSCLRVLTDGGPDKLGRLLDVEPRMRPHLFPLTTIPFFLVGDETYDTACLSNSLFLIILIVAAFLAGKNLGGYAAGFWAAFLVSFYPFVINFSRLYWSEIALMALVAVSIYLLLKTETFSRTGYSLALGLAIGLGMLVKQIYSFFLVAPLLVEGIRIWFSVPESSRPGRGRMTGFLKPTRPKINLILCLLIGAVISVPYYLYYFDTFSTKFAYNVAGGAWEPVESVFSLESMLWYLGHLQRQVSLFFFLLFIPCFITAIISRGRKVILIAVTLAGGYLILSLFPTKDARLISSLLPLIALITAVELNRLKNIIVKVLIFALVVIVSVLNFFQVSWNRGLFNIPYHKSRIILPVYDFELYLVPDARPPLQARDWKIDPIIDEIIRDGEGAGDRGKIKVLVAPYLPEFNVNIFKHHGGLRGLPVEFFDSGTRNLYHYNFKYLLETDYLISKTGESVPESIIRFEFAEKTNKLLNNFPGIFGDQLRLLGEYGLPDGSRGRLFKRIAEPDSGEKITILREVLTIEPGHPWAWQALGETLLEEGELEPAREAFLKVIELLPDWAGGYVHLGGIYLEQGRTEPAFRQIRMGLERTPEWPYAHYMLGGAYEQSGQTARAIEEYTFALRHGKYDLPDKAKAKLRSLGAEPDFAPEGTGE